jgi:hypothetical protein
VITTFVYTPVIWNSGSKVRILSSKLKNIFSPIEKMKKMKITFNVVNFELKMYESYETLRDENNLSFLMRKNSKNLAQFRKFPFSSIKISIFTITLAHI